MRAAKVNKSEFARRLDWDLPQVDRLLEMTHASRLEQLESAFAAMGKRLVVAVEDVANRRSPASAAVGLAEASRRTLAAQPAH
jgi:antitoxin HicB